MAFVPDSLDEKKAMQGRLQQNERNSFGQKVVFLWFFSSRFMDMGMEKRFFSGQKAVVMIGDENLLTLSKL